MKLIFVCILVIALSNKLGASPIGNFQMQQDFVNSLLETIESLIENRNEILSNIMETLREDIYTVLGWESASVANATNVVSAVVQNLTAILASTQNSTTELTQAQNSTTSSSN